VRRCKKEDLKRIARATGGRDTLLFFCIHWWLIIKCTCNTCIWYVLDTPPGSFFRVELMF